MRNRLPGMRRQGGGGEQPVWLQAIDQIIALSPSYIYTAARDVTLDGSGNIERFSNVVNPVVTDDFNQSAAGNRLAWAFSAKFPSGAPVAIGDGASFVRNLFAPSWLPLMQRNGPYTCAVVYYADVGNGLCFSSRNNGASAEEFEYDDTLGNKGFVIPGGSANIVAPRSAPGWYARGQNAATMTVYDDAASASNAVVGGTALGVAAFAARAITGSFIQQLGANWEVGVWVGFTRELSAFDQLSLDVAFKTYGGF